MKLSSLLTAGLCAVAAAGGVTAETRGGNSAVRHWAVEPMSDVMRLPDKVPADGELGGTVRITMAQDEYEPGSFVVQAKADLGKVAFELSEFKTAEGRALPADALDLKFVKVWYQNQNGWFCYFGDTGSMKLVPELLVNDEDLIRVDTAATNNFARLVEADGAVHEQWINPPREIDTRAPGFYAHGDTSVFMPMKSNFRDAKTLQPVRLPGGECKQFILTVHTTPETVAGTYAGEVALVKDGGIRIGVIPVEVKVLPFALPRPKTWVRPDEDFLNCFYNYISFSQIERLNGDDRALTLRQFEAILRDMAEHGQDMHWIHGRPDSSRPDMNFEALWTIDAMRRVGMRTDVFAMEANPRLKPLKKGAPPYTREDYYTNAVGIVKEIEGTLGHHRVYTGYGDEPSEKWLVDNRPAFEGFEDAGIRFLLAGWGQIFAKNPHAMDWQNVGTEPDDRSMPEKWNVLGVKTAWYGHLHVGPENPVTCRRQYGLVPYFSGYSANCNYAHHLGGYNDDTVTYRQMNFVYGTGDGVLDTIQWEGFREGIDDIRYATVLRRMADSAKNSSDGEVRRTARKALAYMVKLNAASDDLPAVRARFVDYILALKSRGVAIPEDVPLASCRGFQVPPAPAHEEKEMMCMGQNISPKYMRGDFKGVCDYFMPRWAREKLRPQHISDMRLALYASLNTGRRDIADLIVSNVTANLAHYTTNGVYEICFAARALGFDAKAPGTGSRLATLEAGLAAGVAPQERLNAIDRTAAAALFGGDAGLARALWNCRTRLLKPQPRRRYSVTWSDNPILGPASWDLLSVEEAPLDRRYQGSLEFLVTDISTGNRGVDAAHAQGDSKSALGFAAVADARGLHFRFTDRTEDAVKIGCGELKGGCYEMYIAPSADMPHTALIWDVAMNSKCATWNCGYECPGYRRIVDSDGSKIASQVVCRNGRVEAYLDLSWKCWQSRLPKDGTLYEFEVMHWGKHSGAWNGTKSIHGRSTWGRLCFSLTDAQRAAIIRNVLLEAKAGNAIGGVVGGWEDDGLGDPEFAKMIVKPRADALLEELKGMTTETHDAEVLEKGERLINETVDFRHAIDRLRARWHWRGETRR